MKMHMRKKTNTPILENIPHDFNVSDAEARMILALRESDQIDRIYAAVAQLQLIAKLTYPTIEADRVMIEVCYSYANALVALIKAYRSGNLKVFEPLYKPRDISMPDDDGPINNIIHPKAQKQIRQEIRRHHGAEVFFIGDVDLLGIVTHVEAHAFGNGNRVPSLTRRLRPGQVVIHNHPSGCLEASGPDIECGSEIGNIGGGCYIVNNQVDAVRIIVKPAAPAATANKPRKAAREAA